jgi:hypothetical protein
VWFTECDWFCKNGLRIAIDYMNVDANEVCKIEKNAVGTESYAFSPSCFNSTLTN